MRLTPVIPPPMTRTSARSGSSPGYLSGGSGQKGTPVLTRAPGACRTVGSGDRITFRCHMDFESYDVLVVGGGLAGIRAAIAVVETNPQAQGRDGFEGLPDAEPHGLGRRRRRRGAPTRGQLRDPRLRHHQGLRLPGRPGRGRGIRARGADRGDPDGALGLPVEPRARRHDLSPAFRRHDHVAHVLRGRQDRLPHAAHGLPDLAQVPADPSPRRGLRDQAPRRGRTLHRRGGDRHAERAVRCDHRQGGDPGHRRPRPHVCLHHQRQHLHRRRHGAGVPSRRRPQGHGDGPVPSDRPAVHGDPDHRGRSGRGRLSDQQGRRALPQALRAHQDGAGAARHHLASHDYRVRRGSRASKARTASTCTSTSGISARR